MSVPLAGFDVGDYLPDPVFAQAVAEGGHASGRNAAVDALEQIGIRLVDVRQGRPDVSREVGTVALGALLTKDRLSFRQDGLVVLVGVLQIAGHGSLGSLAPGDVV